MRMHQHMRGMTLVELMIVVIIVGILTSIAFPNYRAYVARAKRTEAKAALLQCATNQEKWYLQRQEFTTNAAELGFKSPFKTDSGAYQLSVATTDKFENFTCTTTYLEGGAEAGKCSTLAIDSTGNKTSNPEPDCWTRKQ